MISRNEICLKYVNVFVTERLMIKTNVVVKIRQMKYFKSAVHDKSHIDSTLNILGINSVT